MIIRKWLWLVKCVSEGNAVLASLLSCVIVPVFMC